MRPKQTADGDALLTREIARLKPYARPLTDWYAAVRRPLPWRDPQTPYRVWVSEIMLQQTRIEAATAYFRRFMEALPTVADLAAVGEDRLLKLWEGLGYYSRARNLQKAARIVAAEYGGELPADYDALCRLPGIGDYTAGAIASIAFGIPVPAVDGNVMRVFARLTESDRDVLSPAGKRWFTALAGGIQPPECAGLFNEGIMELGETVCLPNARPLCENCPLREGCRACRNGTTNRYPVRAVKTVRRVEDRTVLVICTARPPRRVLLHRRAPEGLLGGMWELPNADGHLTEQEVSDLARQWSGAAVTAVEPLPDARHLFSHIEWRMTGCAVTVSDTDAVGNAPDTVWVTAEELTRDYALPGAFRAYTKPLPDRLACADERPEKEGDGQT